MTKKGEPQRVWTVRERTLLKKLWPTALSDKRLEQVLGRHHHAIHSQARKVLDLPPRTVARDRLFQDIMDELVGI